LFALSGNSALLVTNDDQVYAVGNNSNGILGIKGFESANICDAVLGPMLLFLKLFANAYFSPFLQCILSQLCYAHEKPCSYSFNSYTLAGFEPGSSVPEANAKSTAPRRHARAILAGPFNQ
jgi:hypothetical protein